MGAGPSKIYASPDEHSLCRKCRQLDLTIQTDDEETIIPHSSAKHILKSAHQGCPLCVFLLDLVTRAGSEKNFSGVRLCYPGRFCSGFSVLIDVPGGHSSTSVAIYATRDHVLPKGLSIQNKGVFRRSDDPRGVGLLKDWLAHCTKHHKHCSRSLLAEMPSRLLEISGSGRYLTARLINSKNRNDKYLALSYCWGQPDRHPPKLLSSNINELYAGIAVSSLPLTFRDAVEVVKELQLSHIWIDSLCIIQDDENDKLNEIGRMGEIFANSHLTIAGSDGKDSSSGLFHARITMSNVQLRWNDSATGKSHWVHLRAKRFEYPFTNEVERLTSGYLKKRAWSFQERILSPRVVHFTKTQLEWKCNCRSTFEYNEQPDFDDISEPTLNVPIRVGEKAKLARVLRSGASKHHIYDIWYRLLEQYSVLNMSFDGDKINAIKGIAEAMTEKLDDSLRFGIWENDVRQGLLWSLRPTDGTVRTTNLPVPSWSWAKTHGRLGCINLPPASDLCPSSPTIDSSQMEHGIIALDTLCQSGIVEDQSYLVFGGTFRIHLHLDNDSSLGPKRSRDEIFSDENLHTRQEVHCIHLGTWMPAESGCGTFYGLAVSPTGEGENNIYKRIGMFSTTRPNLSEITSTWQRQRIFLV